MIKDIANEMLALWKEFAEVNDKSTGMNYRNYEEQSAIVTATSALAYDPSGISTAMLVEDFYNRHLKAQNFSISDILSPSDRVQWILQKTQSLSNLFNDEITQASFAGVKESIRAALDHYEVDINERYEGLLANNPALGSLRVSALRNTYELQLDQFLRGEPDTTSKPVFIKQVWKWWSINSLLAAALSMPNGVSLHLIASQKVMESYFVFVIRNGGNLYVLSDIEKEAHPLQSGMRRRPDRQMSERIAKAWFPYELVNVAFDDEYTHMFETASKSKDLVAYQKEWLELSPINELEPEVTIWLSMMFTLIINRFWSENIQVDELSYTGEMLVKSEALIEKASEANLPVLKNTGLQAVHITRESIQVGVATEAEIGETYDLTQSWMEERYGNRVSEEALNLTSSTGEAPLLSLNTSGQIVVMDNTLEKDRTSVSVFDGVGYPLTRFAKASELENDRKFLARATYADSIQKLADEEFERRKDEVVQWFKSAARNNLNSLLSYVGNDEIWIKDDTPGRESTVKGNNARCRTSEKQNYHQFMDRCEIGESHSWRGATRLFSEYSSKIRCNVTDAQASYLYGFTPANAKELAVIAGCEVNDLPDVLQNWDIRRTQTANQILDRMDPMSWKTEDPWIDLNFMVVIALSKRGLAQARKNVKLPPLNIASEQDMHDAGYIFTVYGS